MFSVRRRRIQARNRSVQTLEERALLATITVTSLADNTTPDGEITLREALQAANRDSSVDGSVAGSGADRIEFTAGLKGTISLDSELGALVATDDVNIVGNGRKATIVSAGGADMDVFQVGARDIDVTLQRMDLRNGEVGARNRFLGSKLTLSNARVANNTYGVRVEIGSGVFSRSIAAGNRQGIHAKVGESLLVKDSQVINNKRSGGSRDGGGIHIDRTRTQILRTDISGNQLNRNGRGAGLFATGIRENDVLIRDSTIRNNSIVANQTALGAGVYLDRAGFRMFDSEISGNSASAADVRGAALAGVGGSRVATVVDSSIHGNTAVGEDVYGGVIYFGERGFLAERTSIHSNSTTATVEARGAVFLRDDQFDLLNSTLSENSVAGAGASGAAILIVQANDFSIVHSTIVGDGSGVSIVGSDGGRDIRVQSSVIVSGGPDLALNLNDRTDLVVLNSFIGSNALSGLDAAAPGSPDANGNMIGTADAPIDPMLGPLADNGGPTLTQQPLAGSPLIAAGGSTSFVTDQRGEPFARDSAGVDIGAVEAGDLFLSVTPSTQDIEESDSSVVTFEVRLQTPSDAPITIDYTTLDGSAVAGEDYAATTGELVFVDGSEVLTISVPIIDDELPEYRERFSVALSHDVREVGYEPPTVWIAEDADIGFNVVRALSLQEMSELLIRADEADDIILLEPSGDNYQITWNGQQETIDETDFARVVVHLGHGDNDWDSTGVELPVQLDSGSGDDLIATGAGNDQVFAGAGSDTVRGGAGRDVLRGESGRDLVLGEDGRDQLIGGRGSDTLRGGADRDHLFGSFGNDRLFGEDGDDELDAGRGDDQMDGGLGDDRLDTAVAVDGEKNVLRGGQGDDTLIARGDDLLNGGGGNDWLRQFNASRFATLLGASGNDRIEAYRGEFSGGDGADQILIRPDINPVGITADGGPGNDLITSTSPNSNTLLGGTGNDTLRSENGSDRLDGGEGNDFLNGKGGDDTLLGGPGRDRLNGHSGNDVLSGGQGDDILTGGDGSDSLRGNDGNDIVRGDAGNDIVNGFDGADLLIGGTGSDTITGHEGEDILIAGSTTLGVPRLEGVLDEWLSSRDQATRAANIRDGSGSDDGANRDFFLDSDSVRDDGAADELLGSDDSDWFFANAATDTMTDRLESELFDEI